MRTGHFDIETWRRSPQAVNVLRELGRENVCVRGCSWCRLPPMSALTVVKLNGRCRFKCLGLFKNNGILFAESRSGETLAETSKC